MSLLLPDRMALSIVDFILTTDGEGFDRHGLSCLGGASAVGEYVQG